MLRRSILLAGLATATLARSQSLSARPIRVVVPWPAGGGTDIAARILSVRLGALLNTQIIVENKAGGTGVIGTDYVAKSAPDGHTLVLGTNSTFSIAPNLIKMPYDPIKDLTPVTRVGAVPHILTVHPGVAAKTVLELVALAKAKPDELSFGSSGVGSTVQLAAVQFQIVTGTKLLHVPYKGSGQSVADTVAGNVLISTDTLPSVLQQIKVGRLRALAVMGPSRVSSLPGVPTIAEAGAPGAEGVTWYGLYGPAGMSKALVNEIYSAVAKAMAEPGLKQRFLELGADETISTSPEEFSKMAAAELDRYAKIIKAAGIVPSS
jgi:tripartite-type tricarboxylate transporter receptor subunit TctC